MSSTRMSWKTAVFSTGLLLSALLTACGGGSTESEDERPIYLPGGDSNNTPNIPNTSAPVSRNNGQVGENAAARDCVYVQWCDEPGPRGTICRLRSGCSYSQANSDECIRDTQAVCGAPVQSWYIY